VSDRLQGLTSLRIRARRPLLKEAEEEKIYPLEGCNWLGPHGTNKGREVKKRDRDETSASETDVLGRK